MKKYIIFLLVTLWGFETHGHQLSIELSVEWKKEETEIYHRLNSPSTPSLKIVLLIYLMIQYIYQRFIKINIIYLSFHQR